MHNNSPDWSDQDLKRLQDMFNDGYEDEQIAAELNRSLYAVGRRRRMMGLHRSRSCGVRCKFEIHDAMEEYLPKWWVDILKKRWLEQQAYTKR